MTKKSPENVENSAFFRHHKTWFLWKKWGRYGILFLTNVKEKHP